MRRIIIIDDDDGEEEEEEEENVDTDFGGTVGRSLRVLNIFYKSIDDEENERRVIEKQHERDPNNVEIVEECQNMTCKTWDLEKAKMFAVKMQRANRAGRWTAQRRLALDGMQKKEGVKERTDGGDGERDGGGVENEEEKEAREERTRSCPEN